MKDINDHKKHVHAILFELQKLINELKRMEESMLTQEEILYVISEFAYDWEYWRAPDGSYKYISPSCKSVTGYSPEDFYENSGLLQEIIVAKDWQKWEEHTHTMAKDGEMVPLEFEIVTKDGITKWIHHVCRVVINKKGENIGIRGSNRDITELKKLQHRLEHVAGHDNLTGLVNRALFLEHLAQKIKEAKRNNTTFAVAFIDLDDFKDINDTFGHDAGDHVLKKVARNLQTNLRADDVIARLGGDEFVGIFSINQLGDAISLKEKIHTRIHPDIQCSTFHLTIHLSIGISIFPADGDTIDELLNKADNAMYRMKEKNKAMRQKR